MIALTCPKCGAPTQVGATFCPYCRVGLTHDEAVVSEYDRPSSPPEMPPSAAIPTGWEKFKDTWVGFTIAHPSGWTVITTKGQISVREDPAGLTAAVIWAYNLGSPLSAHQAAIQLTALLRRIDPSFQVWEQSNTAPDSKRISLRTRKIRWGQEVEGLFNILVEGIHVIISGYEAPKTLLGQRSGMMSQILSTFQIIKPMPRHLAQEPGENAFSIMVPDGWFFQGGVNRNNIGGSGATQYSIGMDASGKVMAAMPMQQWRYMEGGGFGMMANFSGMPVVNFMLAEIYCQQMIAPWMNQFQSNFKLEAVVNRPDLADQALLEIAGSGMSPAAFEASVATLETSYYENGLKMRQVSRVGTLRQRSAGGFWGNPTPIWQGILDVYYRAPEDEFKTWEPVLQGIIDSQEMNPTWKAGEQRLAQNYIANSQADIQRRTHQISQTLAETSDIITSGYWNRHANDERYSEMRQNATMGVQNVASDSGETYKVPLGYERYWADGLGNLYGGSWMTQPDINWKPLEPTGI